MPRLAGWASGLHTKHVAMCTFVCAAYCAAYYALITPGYTQAQALAWPGPAISSDAPLSLQVHNLRFKRFMLNDGLSQSTVISIVVMVPLAFNLLRRPTASTPAIRTVWLVGATTSDTMLVFIAAKASDLIPNATAVDVGALTITSILTSVFLALGLKPTHTNEVKG